MFESNTITLMKTALLNAKAPTHEFTCFQTSRTVAGYYTQLRSARCFCYMQRLCVGVYVCASVSASVCMTAFVSLLCMYACKRRVLFSQHERASLSVRIYASFQSLNLCTLIYSEREWTERSWQPCFQVSKFIFPYS